MRTKHCPMQKHLLAALSANDFKRLEADLHLVPFMLGQVLYESGCKLESVYFPTNSIVPMLDVLEHGASVEIAIVGKKGIFGIALFMGGGSTPRLAVEQSADWAYRLSTGSEHLKAWGVMPGKSVRLSSNKPVGNVTAQY